MIELLAHLLLSFFAVAIFVGLPGWALSRLLETQLALPAVLALPAWFALGLGVWTLALLPSLSFGWPWWVAAAVHGALTVALLAALHLRQRRAGHAKSDGRDHVERWTLIGIGLSVLLAAVLRTRLAFDVLFHIGLARRIVELPHATFASVDRIVGSGVNPAYLVPTWQGLLGTVAKLTGQDPAQVIEAMAPFAVLLGACAAAGLGRVITQRAAGEVAAVGAYAWLRVWFPRRELEGDGVGYAFVPGNLAIDVLLPLLLAIAVIVATRGRSSDAADTPSRPLPRGLYVLAAVAGVLYVVLHANYAVYLAIIGLGFLAWLLLVERPGTDVVRSALRAASAVAIPAIVALIAVLPTLLLLDHFGDPAEQRIDYYLVGHGAWEIIRPGHYYDGFGAGGLLAMLLLPFAVLHLRGVRRALLGGGLLALLAVGLVPQLLDVMNATGSRTLGLRLPRPFGVLLIAVLAVAVSWLTQEVRLRAADLRVRRGRAAGVGLIALPLAALFVLAAVYRYPLSRHIPPHYGWNWPTLVAVAGLVVALVLAVRWRRAGRPARDPQPLGTRNAASATGIAVLLVSVALIPSGYVSLKRGGWQSRQLAASVRSDDLACYSAIQPRVAKLRPGAVLLTDPITAYGMQALGPVKVVADYKTWNGVTDAKRIQTRIRLTEAAFDSINEQTTVAAAGTLIERYHPQYVVVAKHTVVPPIDSPLPEFDSSAMRTALSDGSIRARLLAEGRGRLPSNATDEQKDRCDLELWELRSTPQATATGDAEGGTEMKYLGEYGRSRTVIIPLRPLVEVPQGLKVGSLVGILAQRDGTEIWQDLTVVSIDDEAIELRAPDAERGAGARDSIERADRIMLRIERQ
ncbi:MAG: hypothetical protein JWN72_2271 [Thermoleophilia bacterium]|nr:hypothetical protein [Thermoleophilia bacterium]